MFVCPECGLAQAQGGPCPADGVALAPRGDDTLIGTTLGAYRIARLLGVGGMGRVYKGVHPQIGSRVAIKVLSYECAQRADLVERFFAEARSVNLIRHESIVNVLDLSTLPDGRPYIVMEYLDGAPLSDLVAKAGPLPLGSLARLVAEALDALGAAHAKGIVHRDLKPDNIYVTPAGRPKVLDFGIAKLHQNLAPGSATQTGSLLGTPHYMSPEQAMGRPVDLRTDIYAIGVILFECATGRRPFHADSLYDLLRQHIEVPPPSPRALRPDMPPQYEAVILATLAKDPAQRPQSAAALSQALQHATQGLGQEAWVAVTPGTANAMAAQRTPASWPSTQQSWPGGTPPPGGSVPPTDPGAGRGVGHPAGGYPSTGPGQAPTHHYQMTPAHMQPMQQPPSTVSSGQMVQGAPAPSGGGKGLFIGIAVVAVLAGGGAAAYFATRDPGSKAAATASEDEPPADEGDDEAAEPVEKEADDTLDEALDKLDEQLAEAEEKLSQIGVTATTTTTATASNTPPSADDFDGPSPLDRPAGWDPKAFDVSGYYPTAEAAAKAVYPDARLVRIDAEGVRPSGLADLTLDDMYYVRYWFRSEERSKRPDDIPLGVDYETTCNIVVWVDPDGIRIQPLDWDCDGELVPPPKCTFQQAWSKAIKAGAPDGNVVGQVSYMSNIVSHKIRWFFTVGDVYSEQIPDGC